MFWPLRKKDRTYLDFAAGVSGNPSSPHEEGRAARYMLEEARTKIARLVEVQADDVIFTSGATEANALAILGTVRSKQKTENGTIHALYLPSAHASITENMKLAAKEGVEVEPLPLRGAQVDVDALKKMIRPETAFVSMEAVCGETGIVWNTRDVRTVLDAHVGSRRPHMGGGPLLHVDASQAPLTQKITRAHFAADLLVFDVSKIGPVRGIGALIAHRTISLVPLYEGGGQERGLRSGSEAPELVKAFAEALQKASESREVFTARSARMRAAFLGRIAGIPNVYVNENSKNIKNQAPNIVNLSLPERDTDYLVALLDDAGIAVSTRSACETDSEEGSRAIFALTGNKGRALATLRISWGPKVGDAELVRAAEVLEEAVRFVDSHPLR